MKRTMACNLLQTNIMTTQITPSISNDELAKAGLLCPTVQQPSLPPMVRVARGKGFVDKQDFAPSGSATTVKATIKAANPKISSKELCNRVNAVLRGETPLRDQLTVAWVQACIQDGYTGNYGERGHKTACLRMVKVQPEPAKPEPAKPETVESVSAKIAELTAMLAKLQTAK